jgi:poly-beta-1,6-N-acetyl-D-glucosamine synthase
MKPPTYVLVTPVRNEEATIPATIESLIGQTVLPEKWVIVSDGSTDRTDEIVHRYCEKHAFMHLLRLDRNHAPSFASVVFAIEAGCSAVQSMDYDYIGLLDADVRFEPDYYSLLMKKFDGHPKLGLAGGWVRDRVNGRFVSGRLNLKEIAGATQFFRRSCFASLGRLVAIPEGGWDAITCVRARMNGYETRTFPELIMEHLKPRSAVFGNPIRRKWQMGIRDYALASHPLFETFKCLARILERPAIVGSMARLGGYLICHLQRRKLLLSPEIAHFIRREQLDRLFFSWKRTSSSAKVSQSSGGSASDPCLTAVRPEAE